MKINKLDGLLSLDVEYGNSDSFYSAIKSQSFPYYIDRLECNQLHLFKWEGRLVRSKVEIEDEVFKNADRIERALKFNFIDESSLYDLVSRFVVYSNNSRVAKILDKVIQHESSNLYHQYSANSSLCVPIGDDQYLHFSSAARKIPSGFDEVFYVRDEAVINGKYRWIVHHRLIANPNKANLVVRSCHPKIEGVLPGQYLLPKLLKHYLFRIRERKYPNFPVMCVGEIDIPKGECAFISTTVEIK